MKEVKGLTSRFSVLMGGYFTVILIFCGYYTVFLKSFGYSDFSIGIALMWTAISCFICQPVFGYLSDKFNKIKQMIAIVLLVGTAGLPLLFFFYEAPAFIVGFSVVVLGTTQSLTGIIDSWITKLQKQKVKLDYGRVRSIGSLTYAVFAIVLGQLFSSFGNHLAIYAMILVFLTILTVILKIPNPQVHENATHITIRKSASYLFGNKKYVLLLVTAFLSYLTFVSMATFTPLLIQHLGGNQSEVGIAYFIMAFAEFWVMLGFTKLKNKFGVSKLLGFGMVGYFIRSIALSLASNVFLVWVFVALQAISFALFVPGVVYYIAKHVDVKFLSGAALIYQATLSISQMVGNPLFGFLSETMGINSMLMISGIPALIGGTIFLVMNRKKKEPIEIYQP